MSNVHICRPKNCLARRILRCPTCKTRRRFVQALFVWYDSIFTCCGCGDQFSEGYRMQRPARRGWRDDAVRRAKQEWAEATSLREALDAMPPEIESHREAAA
jgi:transposase-like protein